METRPRINYQEILAQSQDLPDIQRSLIQGLATLRDGGASRIGFVSGKLQDMKADSKIMSSYVGVLERSFGFPMVSSTGIFFHELWTRIPEAKLPQPEKTVRMNKLFEGILESGYITDVFMLPGWSEGLGAVAEHKIAIDNVIDTHELGSIESI